MQNNVIGFCPSTVNYKIMDMQVLPYNVPLSGECIIKMHHKIYDFLCVNGDLNKIV